MLQALLRNRAVSTYSVSPTCRDGCARRSGSPLGPVICQFWRTGQKADEGSSPGSQEARGQSAPGDSCPNILASCNNAALGTMVGSGVCVANPHARRGTICHGMGSVMVLGLGFAGQLPGLWVWPCVCLWVCGRVVCVRVFHYSIMCVRAQRLSVHGTVDCRQGGGSD